jgi:hypothetical protein
LWSLWILRVESLRLLLAPRLAALELNRIKVPPTARIPWDFQVLKILFIGMASGRWHGAIKEWLAMTSETRVTMSRATDDKELWRLRLKKLEDLVVYGLIEAKVNLSATFLMIELRSGNTIFEKNDSSVSG